MKMHETEIELGVRRPDDEELARAKQLIAKAGPGPWTGRRLIHANETLDMAKYPATVKVKLQAIRIGGLGSSAVPARRLSRPVWRSRG